MNQALPNEQVSQAAYAAYKADRLNEETPFNVVDFKVIDRETNWLPREDFEYEL